MALKLVVTNEPNQGNCATIEKAQKLQMLLNQAKKLDLPQEVSRLENLIDHLNSSIPTFDYQENMNQALDFYKNHEKVSSVRVANILSFSFNFGTALCKGEFQQVIINDLFSVMFFNAVYVNPQTGADLKCRNYYHSERTSVFNITHVEEHFSHLAFRNPEELRVYRETDSGTLSRVFNQHHENQKKNIQEQELRTVEVPESNVIDRSEMFQIKKRRNLMSEKEPSILNKISELFSKEVNNVVELKK